MLLSSCQWCVPSPEVFAPSETGHYGALTPAASQALSLNFTAGSLLAVEIILLIYGSYSILPLWFQPRSGSHLEPETKCEIIAALKLARMKFHGWQAPCCEIGFWIMSGLRQGRGSAVSLVLDWGLWLLSLEYCGGVELTVWSPASESRLSFFPAPQSLSMRQQAAGLLTQPAGDVMRYQLRP